jgi:hypothetical protein
MHSVGYAAALMTTCRILEIVAGVAAAACVALLVWEDFISTAEQQERWGRSAATLRSGYYVTALVVLACVIVLGVRDC